MYTSEELEQFPEEIERIFSALENDIMQDIIRRILENEEITRTADWELYRLYMMGHTMDEIKEKLNKALEFSGLSVDELFGDVLAQGYARDEEMYKASGKEFIPFEENEQLQQLIGGVKDQTKGTFENITNSLGFVKKIDGKTKNIALSDYLKEKLDESVMHTLNGTMDYNSAIRKIVNEMTNSGVRTIDYESGRSERIEVAARRAVVTGLNQVTSKITEDNMEKLDTEYVEVSWHSTARPSHQEWQGRVFRWNKGAGKEESVKDNKDDVRDDQKNDNKGLNCYGDFLRDVLGAAKDNNKEELEEIKQNVERVGGKLVLLKDSSNMVTNVRKGEPGIIEIDENASIAAVRHEYRHFLDDLENNCPGLAYYLQDRDKYFEHEKRGYEEELVIARNLGYNEIEKKILNEIAKRKEEIYG